MGMYPRNPVVWRAVRPSFKMERQRSAHERNYLYSVAMKDLEEKFGDGAIPARNAFRTFYDTHLVPEHMERNLGWSLPVFDKVFANFAIVLQVNLVEMENFDYASAHEKLMGHKSFIQRKLAENNNYAYE